MDVTIIIPDEHVEAAMTAYGVSSPEDLRAAVTRQVAVQVSAAVARESAVQAVEAFGVDPATIRVRQPNRSRRPQP